MNKSIFPNVRLGRNLNGNKTATFCFPISVNKEARTTIQTNGNLHETHRLQVSDLPLSESKAKEITKEVIEFIQEFGNQSQNRTVIKYVKYLEQVSPNTITELNI